MSAASGRIRGVLARPRLYELWSTLVGAERGRGTLVREYVRPWAGARVLDLGCGPGELLSYLGDVEYVGVDIDEGYIARARQLYGDRAEFRVGDATVLDDDLRDFDVAIAFGLLHHLDDADARRTLDGAAAALLPSGRLVTVDPAIVPGQSWLAQRLLGWDRGDHVRTREEQAAIATGLSDVSTFVRSDLLRLPYTHCVLEARPAS